MNVNIKKLLLTTFMVLSAVLFSSAQTNYSITKKVPEGANPQISIEELAVNHLPYNGKDKIYTRVLAKNGIQFTITFPNSYNNLTIERMNRNIVVEGRRILVKEAGSLAFKYSYIENGESHDCGVLGHVNYYGELEYEGRSDLQANPIEVKATNENDKLVVPNVFPAKGWGFATPNVQIPPKDLTELAVWEETVFSEDREISLKELLRVGAEKGKLQNNKLEIVLEFGDVSANTLMNGVPGGTSFQKITLIDARTYKVNLLQEGQGTISVAKNEFTAGEAVALTAQAAQGWQFSHWEENGQSLGTANPLTFTMEAQHRTIKAVFARIPKFTVTLQIVDTKGAILARSQQQRVQSGGETSFQVPNLPNTNFKGWYHNGQLVGTGNTYSLSNITQDETIQAVFEIPVQTVALSFTELSLKVGERGELPTATVTPDNASDKSISWTSDNPAIAKIEDGSVVAVRSGTTQLIASSVNGKTAVLKVVVTQQPQQPQVVPVQSVTVTPASITAKVGDAPVQLTATVLPANATSPTVSWLSANEQVVKVDSNGKVTIIAAGETTIEAKAGEKTFTVQVKVEAQAPLTPPAEEFPPYIKDFPTEITQGTAINISQWEHLGNINASQIRYHFTDATGKVLGVAPATLQANSLTFTQSGTFVLVATLPTNTAGWTEVRFSITVKIKN